MARSLVAETPVLEWAELEDEFVTLTITPRTGLTLADYGTWTLTVREDPEWPRTGADKAAAHAASPRADGWAVSVSAAGTVASSTTVTFPVTMPAGAGERRYAIDVVADGGTAERVQAYPVTWLTLLPSNKAA